MKLIDAERLEKELTEKSSGYSERAKTILWEYQRILHRQRNWNKWIFAYGIICSGIGFYLGKYSG
jgi:hypothetical protein